MSNGTVISENFNNFFTEVGPTLAKAIPPQTKTPEEYLGPPLNNFIFLSPVNEEEIVKIIKSLNDSAPGHDEIKANILKLSLPYIKEPLTHICNLSLLQGVFPEEMKIANVIPLYKNDDRMRFNNYRPVSLLCVLSKVFEKVMYTKIIRTPG